MARSFITFFNFFSNKIFAKKLFIAISASILFFNLSIYSEQVLDDKYGWSVDLPEGFVMTDATDDLSYLFTHSQIPVTLAIKLYEKNNYKSSEAAFDDVAKKLNFKTSEKETFSWRNANCTLGNFSMNLDNINYEGWATTVELPLKEKYLAVICYTEQKLKQNFEQVIMSILNSIAIDRGSYFSPGIIATYAYPSKETKDISLKINDKEIKTQIGKEDEDANNFVVDMEYAVLLLYQDSPKWREAWQRYYKAIFRDSYERLKKVSFDIQNALLPSATQINKKNTNYALAQILLTWTQNFEYARNKNDADFTPLLSAITGTGCDCDTRSLLLCVILENIGIKTAFFVSRDYSHAIFGADIEEVSKEENARMKAGDKNFLLGETTAKVNLGLISKDFSDTKKWLAIELP